MFYRVILRTLPAAMLLALGVSASAANIQMKTITGWHVGLGPAVYANTDRWRVTQGAAEANTQGSGEALGGELFAGYGKAFNRFYLGADAILRYMPAFSQVDSSGVPAVKKLNSTWSYGAKARFGFLPTTSTLAYLDLGVERAHFKATINANTGSNVTMSDNATGWFPGVGIETQFAQHWIGGLDYNYIIYSTIRKTLNNGSGTNINARFKPRENAVTAYVTYQFS